MPTRFPELHVTKKRNGEQRIEQAVQNDQDSLQVSNDDVRSAYKEIR
jgi:hypothetical protein